MLSFSTIFYHCILNTTVVFGKYNSLHQFPTSLRGCSCARRKVMLSRVNYNTNHVSVWEPNYNLVGSGPSNINPLSTFHAGIYYLIRSNCLLYGTVILTLDLCSYKFLKAQYGIRLGFLCRYVTRLHESSGPRREASGTGCRCIWERKTSLEMQCSSWIMPYVRL